MFDDHKRPGGWGREPNSPESILVDKIVDEACKILDEQYEQVETDDEEEDPNAPQPSYLDCCQCREPIMVGEPYLFELFYPLVEYDSNDGICALHFRCIPEFCRRAFRCMS
jgi:hypothetical protein